MSVATSHSSKKRPFSVARFFKLFEQAIAAIDVYPLTSDNLVIQQDAFRRLGHLEGGTPEESEVEIFASLSFNRKERDSDLCFSLDFAAEVFQLSIESTGVFTFPYKWYFKDEEVAVAQLITTLKMLCSGQFKVLVTRREGGVCATELLLYPGKSRLPIVLTTEAYFPWWWGRDEADEYELTILRNAQLPRENLTLPNYYFLVDYDRQKQVVSQGRTFTSSELTPLTKGAYAETETPPPMQLKRVGRRPHNFLFMYRQWEFWLLLSVTAVGIVGALQLGWLPDWLQTRLWLLALVLGPSCSLLLLPLLRHKEMLKALHKDHPWIRFDRFIRRQKKPRAKRS